MYYAFTSGIKMVSMNVIALVLATLVALDYIGQSDAWITITITIKFGRKKRDIACKELFGLACRTAELNGFQTYGTGCKVYPTEDCHNGKLNLPSTTADGLSYMPLPSKFENYDKDGNQEITLHEFAGPLFDHYQIQNPLELKDMFEAADVNGDGVLGPSEFLVAPYIQVKLTNSALPTANGRNLLHERLENELKQTLENESLDPATAAIEDK